MLRIKFKRDILKEFQSEHIYYGAYCGFYRELLPKKNISRDHKRQEYKQDAERQLKPRQFADDDGNTCSTVVYRIIGQKYKRNRETRHKRSQHY